MKVLLISTPQSSLQALSRGLKTNPAVELCVAESGSQALELAADGSLQLVIAQQDLTDMSGLAFLNKLLAVNPMIDSALTSSLKPDDFHRASEGLGVLMQLPLQPGEEHGRLLLEKLEQVHGLLNP